jgi:cbb3-type cytochrome oxidase maturation protein
MSIIFLLIPLSVLLAAGFLAAFIWAVRSGQYEDTYTPSIRLLLPDPAPPTTTGGLARNNPAEKKGANTGGPDPGSKANVFSRSKGRETQCAE